MDRTLRDVMLPSGKIARIITFFTRGEYKEVERSKWKDTVVEDTGGGNIRVSNVPIDQQLLQDDGLVKVGLKEIKEGDKVITPITIEIIDALNSEDFKAICSELESLYFGKKKVEKV